MITLLTDFGTADYFVGAMKGVILSINPDARIVDITHDIPAFDIEAAAFVVLQTLKDFPSNTTHLAVVDPGVGSERRPILVAAREQFLVGPDNGLFSYVCERESSAKVYHLTNEKYFRHQVTPTFHGRDIFAAVAGALSNGVEPQLLGIEIKDIKRLAPLAPKVSSSGTIEGRIIHIDRFGNCITNLTRDDLTVEMIARGARLQIGNHVVASFRQFFSESKGASGELFALWGSSGFLEIAAFQTSAIRLLGVERGHRVILTGF